MSNLVYNTYTKRESYKRLSSFGLLRSKTFCSSGSNTHLQQWEGYLYTLKSLECSHRHSVGKMRITHHLFTHILAPTVRQTCTKTGGFHDTLSFFIYMFHFSTNSRLTQTLCWTHKSKHCVKFNCHECLPLYLNLKECIIIVSQTANQAYTDL